MESRTKPYGITEGELYKECVYAPLLNFLSRFVGQELMKNIHSSICGAHIDPKALLGKVLRQGFY